MKENGGMYRIKESYVMLCFFDKYRIAPTATSWTRYNWFMIYTATNYATLCRYLCNSVHYVKSIFCYMRTNLGWQKYAMKENGLACNEIKKSYLNALFPP